MDNKRECWLKRLTESEKMDLSYKDFIKSEVEEIINQLLINDRLKKEAKLYFIDCLSIQEVADKMGIDLKTATRHKKRLSHAIKRTICKMFP